MLTDEELALEPPYIQTLIRRRRDRLAGINMMISTLKPDPYVPKWVKNKGMGRMPTDRNLKAWIETDKEAFLPADQRKRTRKSRARKPKTITCKLPKVKKPKTIKCKLPKVKQPRECRLDGCNRRHGTAGLCDMHHLRLIRTGTTESVRHRWDDHVIPECKLDSCTDLAKGRGLCPKHYKRERKWGDPRIKTITDGVKQYED